MSNFSMQSILGDVISMAKKNIAEQKISNGRLLAEYSAGTISTESAQLGGQLVESLGSSIDNIIAAIELSVESAGIHFTEAQKAAARAIAPYALAPDVYAENLEKMKEPAVRGTVKNFGIESMGVDDIVDASAVKGIISTEAFDGQKISNAVYFSLAYNLGAARQDEFGETFFPTITIDPLQSGISVSIEYTSLAKEFSRSINGTPDKLDRTPIIKALYDNTIFATDKNKLVPVFRESDNKAFFLEDHKFVDQSTGSDITTAPLLFGKEVSLLGISQTDELLAKGVMDNTDALDRTLNIEKIFFSMANNDDSKTDIFAIDASLYPFSNFIANPQDHFKAMILNFKNDSIVINLSALKTAKGGTSEVLTEATNSGTYANYKLVFEIAVAGDANTESSNVELQAVKFQLREIRNAANEVVAESDSAYTALKAYADKAKLVGYTLEAYRTNSNIRTRGRLVTNDAYNHVYSVPLRSGVTALFPVNNATGTDNDAGTLTSQVMVAGVITSAYAVKKLTDFAAALNSAAANNILENTQFEGVSRFLVNPWFRATNFELSSVVDSIQSADRDEDIRAALRLKIKNEVLDMYTHSNYGAAFEILRGNLGGNIGVIIGTDPRLKSLLVKDDSTFSLGDNFEAKVVSTLNPLVAGKIFVTFGVFDANRNTTPNPLNFGNCVWSPTINFEITKTHNGAVSRELHNNPRFAHFVNLPILSVFNVTDVQAVFSKLPVHTSAK